MKRVLALAAVAFLIATPIAIAQSTQTPPPETPPTTAAPPPVTQPTTPPTQPTAPPTTQTPSTTPAPSNQSTAAPEGCRTRQPAGEQCACLSDTSRIGTSTAHPDGHNVCVRPG
jgi:hypothetical protein